MFPPVASSVAPSTPSLPPLWTILGCLTLVWAGALLCGVPLAHGLQLGGDEGIELNKAAFLLSHGGWPSEAWNDQPLTHTRLYAWMLGVHYGPLGPRLWSLLTAVLLLVAVAFYTRSLCLPGSGVAPTASDARSASVTAVAAVALLALCPNYSELAVSAMQEVPATAFGMLGLAWVVASRAQDTRRLGIAALAAAFAIAIKLTAGLYALAAWITICSGKPRAAWQSGLATSGPPRRASPLGRSAGRARFIRGLAFAGAVAAFALGLLFWMDGRGWLALLRSHLLAFSASSSTNLDSIPNRWVQIVREFPEYPIFLGAGIARMIRLARQGRSWDSRLLVLPLLALVFNASIRPWWPYYSISLWIGLSPLAGSGLGWAWEVGVAWLTRRSREGLSGNAALVLGGLALLGLGSASWNWANQYVHWRGNTRARDSQILATLRRYSLPGSANRIYAADPVYAFWQKIPTPPEFLVVTRKRFLSGDLTPDTALERLRAADCEFLLFVQDRGPQVTEVWGDFMREHYVLAMVSEGRELYVHRRLDPQPFATTLHW